jgi:hypothetical protein
MASRKQFGYFLFARLNGDMALRIEKAFGVLKCHCPRRSPGCRRLDRGRAAGIGRMIRKRMITRNLSLVPRFQLGFEKLLPKSAARRRSIE